MDTGIDAMALIEETTVVVGRILVVGIDATLDDTINILAVDIGAIVEDGVSNRVDTGGITVDNGVTVDDTTLVTMGNDGVTVDGVIGATAKGNSAGSSDGRIIVDSGGAEDNNGDTVVDTGDIVDDSTLTTGTAEMGSDMETFVNGKENGREDETSNGCRTDE